MTYQEAVAYLHSLQRFGMKPGLDRTRELLARLGRPDRKAGRIVHITGTSGKGSVAAMVESGLRAAGFKVGLYTSPSLERFTDRIQIDRREISEADVARLVSGVRPIVEAMVAEGLEQPTEFEVTTAMAFLYFARQQVDWLVLEVGLGGRFDATTVVEDPAVTCITNIGLDHTQWLGNTCEDVAWDKAGIIKPGIPCITGTDHPGSLTVIRDVALAAGAPLVEVKAADAQIIRFGPEGQVVNLLGERGWYRDVDLGLLGPHQALNGALAVRLLERAGVSEEAIRNGLGQVVWPGRFEVWKRAGGLTVVLDGAHNPAKCQALAESVHEYFPNRRVLLVLGVLADKDVPMMIGPLLDLAAQVWVTTPESPRQMTAEALAAICLELGHTVLVETSIPKAVDAAVSTAQPGDLVLITGSFYSVGPARRHLHTLAKEA